MSATIVRTSKRRPFVEPLASRRHSDRDGGRDFYLYLEHDPEPETSPDREGVGPMGDVDAT